MEQQIVQVDAFTDTRYRGNPAAICPMEAMPDDDWMQAVALEMNLSETCYLVPERTGYRLRWFTPAREVRLCGHATLASAHYLYENGLKSPDESCIFHTLSGELRASRSEGWIEVSFPGQPPEIVETPEGLQTALGTEIVEFGQNDLNYGHVVVHSEATVRNLEPDFVRLAGLPHLGYGVTAPGDGDTYDFVSRFFAPSAGINEDPVTGSAHCMFGPYWAAQRSRNEMVAYQASPRGGTVRVRIEGDRVVLGGRCVTTMRGVLV